MARIEQTVGWAPAPEMIHLLASTAQAVEARVEIRDRAGVLRWSGPRLPGEPAGEVAHRQSLARDSACVAFSGGSLLLAPAERPDGPPPERAPRLQRIARRLARLLDADVQRTARADSVARLQAQLARQRDFIRRCAWSGAAAHEQPVVSRALLSALAAELGQGWVLVSLAGQDFTYAEPCEPNAVVPGSDAASPGSGAIEPDSVPVLPGSDAASPGRAPSFTAPDDAWNALALQVHMALSGAERTWVRYADEFAMPISTWAPPGLVDDGTSLVLDCLPVRAQERMVGFVAWIHPTTPHDRFPDGRQPLEGLARQIAQALDTLQMRSEMLGFLFMTLKSLAAAVDAKDRYTRGHSERVHYLAMRAGEQMDLDAEALQNLSWAALLHDLGKIGIPSAILSKETPLTSEEWSAIHEHPEKGCKVVARIPQLSGTLAAIRHHHERYDGTGYPDGLADTRIPLLARILAVADAFDAITSERPYSARRSIPEALHILRQAAGWQFDPQAVAAVCRAVEQEMSGGTLAFEVQREAPQSRSKS